MCRLCIRSSSVERSPVFQFTSLRSSPYLVWPERCVDTAYRDAYLFVCSSCSFRSFGVCLLVNLHAFRSMQRSLEESGERLVAFMDENEQYRVKHRFCKPFIGTSQDEIMRRVSRGNKKMAKALKVCVMMRTQYGGSGEGELVGWQEYST